ncbi:MAG: hypothetical protein V1781_04115 [Bacteroidota bacterium]
MKKKMLLNFSFLFSVKKLGIMLLFLFLLSCKKDIEPTSNFNYEYFPHEVGRYVIYDVDSTWQDDISNVFNKTRYRVKESITSIFTDLQGRPTMRIERYYKFYNDTISYDSITWSQPKVWYANLTATTAEKVENNVRYIKLIFPAKKEKTWNGNAYNTKPYRKYEITYIDNPEIVNNIHFDSVIQVTQFNDINFILYQNEFEKFAKGVGLIYKKMDSLKWNGGRDTIGYTFTQKIVSYGK